MAELGLIVGGGLAADLILKAELNHMWELACLRWHQLVMPDVPSCLHRRQASSHRKAEQTRLVAELGLIVGGGLAADLILKAELNQMWELACLRWHQLGVPERPMCLHRRQTSSHRKAEHTGLAAELGKIVGGGLVADLILEADLNQMWELACLRWHQLVMPDVPSCLHRRQASSHR
ncbi:hypothetical protein IMF22_12930 [Pseudomonas poae]|uniref:Uncharacterized protein n=1 Tax=Pseudomonas poae TaxID=200451 RepID=A0A7M1KP07_9PSED|nr:hypothetical protein [Pseudomonas poae]QOQ77864.1 hypothetical protein IMF22_12930 [Pseudomonas poae]